MVFIWIMLVVKVSMMYSCIVVFSCNYFIYVLCGLYMICVFKFLKLNGYRFNILDFYCIWLLLLVNYIELMFYYDIFF